MKKGTSLQSILLRRNWSLDISVGEKVKEVDNKHILALKTECANYGFRLSKDVIEVLQSLTKKKIKEVHKLLMDNLPEMIGDKTSRRPLFQNFPNELPSETSIFINKIENLFATFIPKNQKDQFKVLECGDILDLELLNEEDFGACPVCGKQINKELLVPQKPRTKLREKTVLKEIKLAKENEILNIFTQLITSRISFSKRDSLDLKLILNSFSDEEIIKLMPKEIPFKEVLVLTLGTLISSFEEDTFKSIVKKIKLTATDILRLAAYLSEADISLASCPYFKSFSNKQRRLLLTLLETSNGIEESFAKYSEEWKRFGEKVHPRQYKKFVNVNKFFKILRNSESELKTFYSQVERLIDFNDMNKLIKVLSKRPGELFRRIDFIMRNPKTDFDLLEKTILETVGDIESKNLISLKTFLTYRTNKTDVKRNFIPKGSVSKMYVLRNGDKLPLLGKRNVKKLIKIFDMELEKRFKELGNIKENSKVFIDPALKKCLVPLSQRNASASLRTLPRGSRLQNEGQTNVIRLFTYWKGLVDLDLSAGLYSSNWENKGSITYYELFNETLNSYHSGDLRSAPEGGSEFIDIDINKLKEFGIRYIVMSVNSFSGESFEEFETFCGFMNRENPNSGEVYEPKTVAQKIDLVGESKSIVPFIFDLETNEMIVLDMSISADSLSNYSSSENKILETVKSVLDFENSKPNVFDLFNTHAKALNCEILTSLENQDLEDVTQFTLDKGVTPFNISEISANWLK